MLDSRKHANADQDTTAATSVAARVGVLGDAGIGKSTLLNALVIGGRSILPAGGVGPLTGRATRLRHAPRPFFSIRYLPAERMFALCYALEHLEASGGGRRVRESDYRGRLPSDVRRAVRLTALGPGSGLIAKEARLLIVGAPDSPEPLGNIRGGLRKLLNLPVRAGDPSAEPDPQLVFRCRQRLRAGEGGMIVEQPLDADDDGSLERLAAHVVGPLSVLTDEVTVGWPSEVLASGLELVDLPGLGVALDSHQQVTHRWLRSGCGGLTLVCSRAGISSPCERALIESGALSSLVASWSESRPSIVIVVTKLDDEAEQIRRQDKSLSARARFAELSEAVAPVMRGQLLAMLRRALKTMPDAALQALAAATPVVAAAAPTFQLLHRNDAELRPLLPTLAETNIPKLSALLASLGQGLASLSLSARSDGTLVRNRARATSKPPGAQR